MTFRSARAGSIPACAGEPLIFIAHSPCARVYPRVCGGTSKYMNDTMELLGLSPRVRGNRFAPVSDEPGIRSIPACAGEP